MQKMLIISEIMFAVFVFVRISDILRTKNLISSSAKHTMMIFLTVWMLVGVIFFSHSATVMTVFVTTPLAHLFVSPLYLRARRQKRLREELPHFINTVILRMSVGDSLNSALRAAQSQVSDWVRVKISQVLEIVEVSVPEKAVDRNENNDWFFSILREIAAIHRAQHQALSRLKLLREKLAVEEQFRKKRDRVTAMVRAQATILSVLYLGLLAFVFWNEDLRQIHGYLTASILLFTLGTVGIFWIGRRFRWKV